MGEEIHWKEVLGQPHPHAPVELAHFAFLVGRFTCEARIKTGKEWQRLDATWEGRWILDGFAIADEYRVVGAFGQLVILGMSVRIYDAAHKRWNMKWLNAVGIWTDLGPEELGGVRIGEGSISYVFRGLVAGHALTRSTFSDISEVHFKWQADMSDDGEVWEEFMSAEAWRT